VTPLILLGGVGPFPAASLTAAAGGDIRSWLGNRVDVGAPLRVWAATVLVPVGPRVVALVVAVLAGGGSDRADLFPAGAVPAEGFATFIRGASRSRDSADSRFPSSSGASAPSGPVSSSASSGRSGTSRFSQAWALTGRHAVRTVRHGCRRDQRHHDLAVQRRRWAGAGPGRLPHALERGVRDGRRWIRRRRGPVRCGAAGRRLGRRVGLGWRYDTTRRSSQPLPDGGLDFTETQTGTGQTEDPVAGTSRTIAQNHRRSISM
jgi:hypothetical protein